MAEYKGILNPVPKNRGGYENYSATEHEIGTWIDGSKLYEKTISCGALPSGVPKTVAHGISNLNKVFEINNIAIRDDGEVFRDFDSFGASGAVVYYLTKTNITISAPSGSDSYNECYVTIRYTKTA